MPLPACNARPRLGLVGRLLLPIVMVILVAGSIRTVLVALEEKTFVEQRLAAGEVLVESGIAPLFASLPADPPDALVRDILEPFARLPGIHHLSWRSGGQFVRVAHAPVEVDYPAWFAARMLALPLERTLPLHRHGGSVGELGIALDPSELLNSAWRRVQAQAQTVSAVIALLLLAITLILRSTLSGLRSLRHAAEQIGGGQFYARARLEGSAEVRAAALCFNRMAESVALELNARRQLEGALRDKQAMFSGVLEAMGEAVLVIDADTCIRLANPAARSLLDEPEPIGRSLASLLPLVKGDGGGELDWFAALQAAAANGSQPLGNVVFDGRSEPRSLEGSIMPMGPSGSGDSIVVLRDVSEIKRLLVDAEWQASHDPLTGLPNRLLLADRLHQACLVAERQASLVAVCLFDLDGFKPVNDFYGHEIGDQLLAECAQRVEASLRGMDTVIRLGGDEFVVLLSGIEDEAQVMAGIERVLTVIARPYEIAGRSLRISASMGFTLYPLDNSDPDTLLRHADQAMYAAKEAGRATWSRYAPIPASRQPDPLPRLAEALQAGELEFFYQPQINMRTGEVLGFEALMRWRHPERGLLAPGEFLPDAERSPLIDTLGDWGIAEALREIERWQARGRNFTIAVNIAGRHFLSQGFVARLKAHLARHPGLPEFALRLEITESSALADMVYAASVVRDCRALKVGVAVDDFGTGYASLAYLRQLPVDELKIDQHFVRDILDDKSDMALVEAVISLAAVFEREVLAEGVETAEHGVLLMRLGCDRAQGYGIARPMPAAAIGDWLAAWQPDPGWARWADTKWEISDFPLMVAQYDHQRWVERILQYLDGGGLQLSPHELANHRQCRFGLWYDGPGQERYGHLPEFALIDKWHREVHRLGVRIVALADDGDSAAARHLGAELEQARARILALMADLQHVVARAA